MLSGQVAAAEPVSRWQLQDAVEAWENIRCVSKVKGVAFSPMVLPSKGDSGSGGEERMFRVLVSLANNSLELYDLSTAAATTAAAAAAENSDDKKRASQYVVIDSGGHRLGFLRIYVSTMHQDLSILLYVCMYVYIKYSYTIYTTTYIHVFFNLPGLSRTDIRSVCISDDSQTLCTCSSESVKVKEKGIIL